MSGPVVRAGLLLAVFSPGLYSSWVVKTIRFLESAFPPEQALLPERRHFFFTSVVWLIS